MYDWMKVLASMHTYYVETGISVDISPERKRDIAILQEVIEISVVLSCSDVASDIDDRDTGDRFSEDYSDRDRHHMLVNKTAVLKRVDGLDSISENVAVETMVIL